MIKDYFQLQHKMIDRHIQAFGLPVLAGYIMALVAFVSFSWSLFSKTEFAVYLYIFFGLTTVGRLSESRRIDLLKSSFRKKEYQQIRILENMLLALPFVLILAIKIEFLAALAMIFLAALMALVNYNGAFSKTMPTPFGKRPFEFVVGFRKTFYLFVLAYFLAFMAVWVDNFNLGAFALMLVFFVVLIFYSEPEQTYFVWIHGMNAKQFLWHKMKTFLLYSTWLSLPVLVVMGIFFIEKLAILALLMLLGYTYVIVIILAKYGAFPNKVNIPDGFLIAMSFFFPPILVGVIPFFLRKSLRRLNNILA